MNEFNFNDYSICIRNSISEIAEKGSQEIASSITKSYQSTDELTPKQQEEIFNELFDIEASLR